MYGCRDRCARLGAVAVRARLVSSCWTRSKSAWSTSGWWARSLEVTQVSRSFQRMMAVWPCTCRECHPGSSGGVLVFVKDTAEAVMSVDVQPGELVRVGDRFGQRLQRPEVRDPLMRSV
jgi:hypothetical protein